jgi:hypothetical protein
MHLSDYVAKMKLTATKRGISEASSLQLIAILLKRQGDAEEIRAANLEAEE